MGHINYKELIKVANKKLITEVPKLSQVIPYMVIV